MTRYWVASIFVAGVLGLAEDKFERKYELMRLAQNLGRVAAIVCEVFELKAEDVFSQDK